MFPHVRYVTEPEPAPDPLGFILDTLSHPGHVALLVAGGLAVLGLLAAWHRLRPMEDARLRLVARATSYRDLVPWMLRLSFGLVLLGAGLTRVLFAPDVRPPDWPYLVLSALGFLLLLGLAVRPAALAALLVYLGGLVWQPGLIEIWDVAGGLAALALLGPGLPSLDDLLRHAFPRAPGRAAVTEGPTTGVYADLVPLLARIGLGGAFVASGIVDKFLSYPQGLEAVAKYGLTSLVPVAPEMWVVGAGVLESTLGLAILLGVMTRFSVVTGFAVLTLAVFGLPDDPILAHVGLFGLSSVLFVLGAGRWGVDAWLGRRFATSGTADPVDARGC
ncbi:MAG TPA: DoxX family protein [Candidatus Limnocylindria bacterium]|nr:DoxX family protein [Candidatus Limnocylindria bacterium]